MESFIVLDELLFQDSQHLKAYFDDLLKRDALDGVTLEEFRKVHGDALANLKKDPKLSLLVADLEKGNPGIRLDELYFKNGEEFSEYADKLISENTHNPYVIHYFLISHKKALEKYSHRDDVDAVINKLNSTQAIAIDEYAFTDKASLMEFADKLIKANKVDGVAIANFLECHKLTLGKIPNRPLIREFLKKLRIGNKTIRVNENLFSSKKDFKANLTRISALNAKVPGISKEYQNTRAEALNSIQRSLESRAFNVFEASINQVYSFDQALVNGVVYPTVLPVGSIFKFGNYWQESSEKKSPIEWLVLKREEKKALLISKYALDCMQYYHDLKDMTWKHSDLRKWLNSEFLKNAFSCEEQARIPVTHVVNEDNKGWGTRGGNATLDRVFCLSGIEAESLFKDNNARKCLPTAYARKNNACFSEENGCCCYWLRPPSGNSRIALCVLDTGSFCLFGSHYVCDDYAVRPALWINL